MKDLIIINSYTPDYEREGLLRNFVNQIDKTNFDLMVVSHSRLPDDLYEKVDYFIYDKENEILTDIYSKYSILWGTPAFYISTTEGRKFNHSIAAYKLFFMGVNNAKNLGYEKAHVIEYDTSITDMSHFNDNSKLLDNYSLVYYKTNNELGLISFPMSFNIKKLNEEWFPLQKEKVIRDPNKTLEDWESRLIKDQENTYFRSHLTLADGSIAINLYASYKDQILTCPVVDKNNNLILLVNNPLEETLHYRIIINQTIIKNFNIPLRNWATLLLSDYDGINHLLIVNHKNEVTEWDFSQIDKDYYKDKNIFHING